MGISTEKMVKIESRSDTGSFLVPCYGFEKPGQAIKYAVGPWAGECRLIGPEDAYSPIFWGHKSYVARVSAQSSKWRAGEFISRSESRHRDRPAIWEMIRGKDTAKPDGAYHAALLVEGRRQFYHHSRETTKHPKWWYRLSDGWKDCYAVWARRDGSEIADGMFVDGDRRVFVARSARGVLYSREMLFANSGEPCGWRVELVRVELSILDRDPAKDDMLKVAVVNTTFSSEEPAKVPELSLDHLDEVWRGLIGDAIDGFEEHCQPVSQKVEAWRQFFLDQREKAEADRRRYSDSFAERVKALDWQEALWQVEEPWQLAAVVGAHARKSEFYDSPGYSGATGTRVRNMLALQVCDDARREQLQKMVADYVEHGDSLWDYTGD